GFGDELANVCQVWPTPPASASAAAPVVSDVPTLLLSGHFDPITPPEYARDTAATLSQSYEVEFATQGHVTLWSGACSIGIARQFLGAPDRQPDATCAARNDLTFVLP